MNSCCMVIIHGHGAKIWKGVYSRLLSSFFFVSAVCVREGVPTRASGSGLPPNGASPRSRRLISHFQPRRRSPVAEQSLNPRAHARSLAPIPLLKFRKLFTKFCMREQWWKLNSCIDKAFGTYEHVLVDP